MYDKEYYKNYYYNNKEKVALISKKYYLNHLNERIEYIIKTIQKSV